MKSRTLPVTAPVLFALALLSLLLLALVMPDLAAAADGPGRSSWGIRSLLGAAGVPSPNNELVLSGVQLLSLLFGALVPLGGYALNHYAPWVSEPVKALVQVILAALAGALVQLVDAGDLAFDLETLEVVGTAVVGALVAHRTLWLPAGISTAFGGGSNSQPR